MRFFSPPENPTFKSRLTKSGETFRAMLASRSRFVQSRSLGAWPSMAVLAVRRKFVTDTPGTSTGYCIARKSPARARSSGVMSVISSPFRNTRPSVTVYLGWPARA